MRTSGRPPCEQQLLWSCSKWLGYKGEWTIYNYTGEAAVPAVTLEAIRTFKFEGFLLIY